MRWARIVGWTQWRLAICALALAPLLAAPAPAPAPADTRPGQGPPGEREVTVFNRSLRPVNEMYVSPGSAEQWGDDRLGEHTLDPGDSLRLRLGRLRDCLFDLRVVYDDASLEEARGVNLCRIHQVTFDGSTALPPPDSGPEHTVTLLNRARRPVKQVFISPAASNEWGEDRLGQTSISVGEARAVTWRGDCTVDLRVVFENHAAEERRGVDLCETPAVSLQPGWTTEDRLPAP